MSSQIFAFILEEFDSVNNLADKKVVMECMLQKMIVFILAKLLSPCLGSLC